MKCIQFIIFSIVLMTVVICGSAGFAQQEDSQKESSAAVTKTDSSASPAGETLNDSEIKDIPASAESEGSDKAEEGSAEKTDLPKTGEEKKAEVPAEKSDDPKAGEEEKADVSPEKSGVPESGEEKKAEVPAEKSDEPKAGEEKKADVSPEKSGVPISGEEKKAEVPAEKSDAPKAEEEKKADVSPEKSGVPISGEEKKADVSSEKADTPEDKKIQDSPVSPKTLSIQVKKANVRKDASLNAKINAQLKKGQAVTVIEVKDEWYHIQLDDGEHGWVHRSTLGEKTFTGKEAKPGDSMTLTVKGNVRVSPDLGSEVLTVLKKGEAVIIKESQEEWHHVQLPDGRDGWVHKKLFAKPVRMYDLEGIRIETDGKDREKVYFMYNGPKSPDIFITKAVSPRIICDFPNTRRGKGIRQKMEVNGRLIQVLRTGLHGGDKSDLRVVFDVDPDAEYELEHSFAEKEMYLLIVKKR